VFRSSVSDSASSVGLSYAPSASGTSSISAPTPITPTDTYVAEKVAYWISNDVQNAEMKLDGIGDKPVEVSIRMQGNEAHIAFRSDELQARAALENASIHLKDMLQREGLVLSGVSVGTAGAGDSNGQERQSRQGARQASVVSVQPASADRASVAGRASGAALDLFV
jgi:flagellar hook-length control protein FliK